jgi:uncharacterized protein YndB with AHSA1/START domain
MQHKKTTDKIIKKSRIVRCSVDEVWHKWTTHEGLLTFFGADNNVELRLGGAFEIYFLMDNPKGLQGGEGCKIISYVPKKMLSFTWNAPPQYPEILNYPYKTWVVVHFKVQKNGTSKVILQHLGWPEGKQWDEVYNYFDVAWETVLNRLEKSCEN